MFLQKLRDLAGMGAGMSIASIPWKEEAKRVTKIGASAKDIQTAVKQTFSAAGICIGND